MHKRSNLKTVKDDLYIHLRKSIVIKEISICIYQKYSIHFPISFKTELTHTRKKKLFKYIFLNAVKRTFKFNKSGLKSFDL